MIEPEKRKFDLAIAWNWEYDSDFINLIEEIARSMGISTFLIHTDNVGEVYEFVRNNVLFFRVFLDRASDTDDRFEPFARFAMRSEIENNEHHRIVVINPYDLLHRAADKATMHLEFLTHNIQVPYTIIISPYRHDPEPDLSHDQLGLIGTPFIIKPANTTGGGIGVILDAKTLHDVLTARKHYENDKYLLQEYIHAALFGKRKAWFRIFYAFGKIIPCWWDDETHIYDIVSPEEEEAFNLKDLRKIVMKIYRVCRLHFFSTEVACTNNGIFVVVDYVNEMCDMRMRSKTPDGVPDEVVQEIIVSMLSFVYVQKNQQLPARIEEVTY
jgi:hypothetical protein